MPRSREIVITGVGVVSPIGIGRDAFWRSLCAGQSGVRRLWAFDREDLPIRIGAEVADFDPKQYVTPRKSLKVMSRDIQLSFAAAQLAVQDAALEPATLDPDRFGVVLGADMIRIDPTELIEPYRACLAGGRFDYDRWGGHSLGEMFPLWLLKYLPNMSACHIAIALDARGPNNSITMAEVSSLLALGEAVRTIERGQADVIITGGGGSRVNPLFWTIVDNSVASRRFQEPESASRPFDADRDGMVYGEGAAAFIVESRQHAESRGAKILARVLGFSSTFERRDCDRSTTGAGTVAAIRGALRDAHMEPSQVGHVNAHGLSTVAEDRMEAQAIHETVGDIPVTAPKSFFGNLGGGTGAVEMAASVLALETGIVPATLNFERADPLCPIEVLRGQPASIDRRTALLLNQAPMGQSVAVVLAGGN